MCLTWPVNPVHIFCHVEVTTVTGLSGGRVIVVMSTVTMVTEAVEMLHPQVEILITSNKVTTYSVRFISILLSFRSYYHLVQKGIV